MDTNARTRSKKKEIEQDKEFCEVGEHYVYKEDHWKNNGYPLCGDCMNCTNEKELEELGLHQGHLHMRQEATEEKEDEVTKKAIWVSNSCGKLFIFNNVPTPFDLPFWENAVSDFWDKNNISRVVGNNYNSCDWGEFKGEADITHIKTPLGGWKEDSDSKG